MNKPLDFREEKVYTKFKYIKSEVKLCQRLNRQRWKVKLVLKL